MTSKSTTTRKKQLEQLKEGWKPHKYQQKAIKFMLQQGAGALFLDPGLGKTSITLAAIKILKKEKLINKVLIVAPLRPCYLVWPKEIEKWADFNNLTYTVVHGSTKQKKIKEDVDIYIVNPEGLDWFIQVQGMNIVKPDMLVIDESSKFKNNNAKRTKLLKSIIHKFRRRYILTGTPSPNSMLDLFSQIYLLDGGAALGKFITHFRHQFFYQAGYMGYEWKMQEGAEKKIQDAIKPLVLRMEANDYLELPQLVESTMWVDLPANARSAYDEMEKELFIALTKGDVVAANAAAASIKCRQIANGGVYDEDHKAHHLHDEKAEAVLELVEELQGAPLLVAYDFQHDLERLLRVLGKDTPYIGGGVSAKRGAELEALWNAGKLPVLLGHPASISHGLNLQGAGNHVAWHSMTYNFENYDQFNKRVLRQGNKHKKVFVHHILAANTVDEAVLAAVRFKDKTQKSLLTGLKEYMKKVQK